MSTSHGYQMGALLTVDARLNLVPGHIALDQVLPGPVNRFFRPFDLDSVAFTKRFIQLNHSPSDRSGHPAPPTASPARPSGYLRHPVAFEATADRTVSYAAVTRPGRTGISTNGNVYGEMSEYETGVMFMPPDPQPAIAFDIPAVNSLLSANSDSNDVPAGVTKPSRW